MSASHATAVKVSQVVVVIVASSMAVATSFAQQGGLPSHDEEASLQALEQA